MGDIKILYENEVKRTKTWYWKMYKWKKNNESVVRTYCIKRIKPLDCNNLLKTRVSYLKVPMRDTISAEPWTKDSVHKIIIQVFSTKPYPKWQKMIGLQDVKLLKISSFIQAKVFIWRLNPNSIPIYTYNFVNNN
jgi:hypothetical protein